MTPTGDLMLDALLVNTEELKKLNILLTKIETNTKTTASL